MPDYGAAEVSLVFEVRGKNQPPYCYRILVKKAEPKKSSNNDWHDHSLIYEIWDMDGDGIFETKPLSSAKNTVPDWVK